VLVDVLVDLSLQTAKMEEATKKTEANLKEMTIADALSDGIITTDAVITVVSGGLPEVSGVPIHAINGLGDQSEISNHGCFSCCFGRCPTYTSLKMFSLAHCDIYVSTQYVSAFLIFAFQ